ncbi:MAG: hypothetical protein ACPGUE_08470 [Marinomonas sp.]
MIANKYLILGASLLINSQLIAATDESECHQLDAPWIAITSGQVTLSAKSQPSTISTSEPFSLFVSVCEGLHPYSGKLKFDAQMPLHKHGMNYQPSIIQLEEGRFLIQGNLLHMPGLWQFSFSLDSHPQALFYNYDLP